jgi:succinate-semialdehyde dehydrogenase/glutarate-semialdehyde dehydrogenase
MERPDPRQPRGPRADPHQQQGKPLAESKGIQIGASYIEWSPRKPSASMATRSHALPTRIVVIKQPVVCARRSRVNCPAFDDHPQDRASLRRCTVVLKPAGQTPYSRWRWRSSPSAPVFPKGVINILTGESRAIARAVPQSWRAKVLVQRLSTEIGGCS